MFNNLVYLFLLGIFFASGPCLASCGPLLISYIVGTNQNIFKGLKTYALFSLSRIFVYVVLSLVIAFLGKAGLERLLGQYSKYIFILGGIFVVLLGVLTAIAKSPEFKFCSYLKQNIIERDVKSILVLGLIVGLLPCAPLLAVLSYIGLVSNSWTNSLVYGAVFGLGTFISPLILLAGFSGWIQRLFVNQKSFYNKIFSLCCGLIIIFLGLQLIRRAF